LTTQSQKQNTDGKPNGNDSHAVVIGASMAGLLAARVLADYFDRVTVVERDELPNGPLARRGVPQGRHVHSVLARGDQIMERLFPGLFHTLLQEGAELIDLSNDMSWHHFGVTKLKFVSGVGMYTLSRPFLEWHVRKRLTDCPNVRLIDQCKVLGFSTNTGRTRITGVDIRFDNAISRGDRHGRDEELKADLVVDASGRGSRTPQWLEELGYPKPLEWVINVNVGYATRFYRRPPGADKEWRVLLVYPTPPAETRLGVIFPVEENRWMATLAGWIGDHPPDDEQGYLEFARNLSTPAFYKAVKDAEPLSPIVTHKFPSNLRRHYENLDRFPEGLVVLGDALCSFNPIYGQGMTTAAMAVSILGECLERQRKGVEDSAAMTRRFRKMSHKAVDTAWMIAASEDFRYPTVGRVPLSTKLINRYFHRVHELGSCDPEVHRRFLQVMTMIKPASTIFRPRIIWRVLTSRLPNKPNKEEKHVYSETPQTF
jgi:2-polyprenyl-6-methoxyphenol hydroxylase-like FAD-dependent oxidoreductase